MFRVRSLRELENAGLHSKLFLAVKQLQDHAYTSPDTAISEAGVSVDEALVRHLVEFKERETTM